MMRFPPPPPLTTTPPFLKDESYLRRISISRSSHHLSCAVSRLCELIVVFKLKGNSLYLRCNQTKMPKFFSSSPFDHDVEKATSEMNTTEDWETIFEICDSVKEKPNGAKDCLHSIVKRLNSNVPHHAMHALTLLDACIKNCDRRFHLEVCSRDFEVEIKKLLNKGHPKVVDKLKTCLKRWSEEVFSNDPELSLIPSLYNSLKNDRVDFPSDTVQTNKTSMARLKDSSAVTSQQEEEDLAKAIELSLKESSSSQSSTLYPIASVSSASVSKPAKEPRKVRALYDFEAAEDNEITFRAGEILLVLDSSDPNWWKGSNHRGEGLFPANFVTADLTAEPEPTKPEKKSVQFNEEVKVKTLSTVELNEEVEIDEKTIDRMLHLLHEADPTGERPDSEELLALEDNCMAMGPRIDQELEEIDRRHASLTAANQQLVDALNFYQTLMKDYTAIGGPYAHTPYPVPDVMRYPPSVAQHQIYGPPLPGTNYMPTEQYHPITAPPSTDRYAAPLPPSGALPTIQSRVMHPTSHPHIPFATPNQNSYPSIPQTSMPMTTGNFTAPLPSRDQNPMYYGDMVVTSVPPSSARLPLQQQPMS